MGCVQFVNLTELYNCDMYTTFSVHGINFNKKIK